MTQTLTFRLEKSLQTIEGFGASGCWWAQALGNWKEEALGSVLDLLYSSSKGFRQLILGRAVASHESPLWSLLSQAF